MNFFVFAVSLEHRTDGDERFVSGIDTRGAAASCYFSSKQHPGTDWNTGIAGVGGNPINRNAQAVANQTTVFAECTSLLRVMANKVISYTFLVLCNESRDSFRLISTLRSGWRGRLCYVLARTLEMYNNPNNTSGLYKSSLTASTPIRLRLVI